MEIRPGVEEGMDVQKDRNSVRRVRQEKRRIKKYRAEANTAGN